MAAFRKRDVLLLFLAIFFCDDAHASSNLPYRQGILEAKSGNAVESLCVVFYPDFTSYPTEKENGVYEPSLNLSEMWDGCSIPCEIVAAAIKDEIALVNELGNCLIIKKAQSVKRLGGKGIIIMAATAGLEPLPSNATYPAVIPIALPCSDPKNILMGLGDCVEVLIHSSVSITCFDYSLLAIFAFSMLAVAGIGAYLVGLKEYCFRHKETQQLEKETVSPLFLTAFILFTCSIISPFWIPLLELQS